MIARNLRLSMKKIICCMSYLQIWKSMLADAQGKLYECEGQRKAKRKSPRQEDALPTVKANLLSPEDMIKERCLPKFRNLCTENRYGTFMAKKPYLWLSSKFASVGRDNRSTMWRGPRGDILWIVIVKVLNDSIKAGSYEVIQVNEWIGRYKRLALDIDIELSIRISTFRVYS